MATRRRNAHCLLPADAKMKIQGFKKERERMIDMKLKKKRTSTAERNGKENDFLIKESSHKIRRQGLLSVLGM